jgi:predicted nucleic-acid-binding Zn-ribbon protein
MDVTKEPCIICGNVNYQIGHIAYRLGNPRTSYSCVVFEWNGPKEGIWGRLPHRDTYARQCLDCGNVQIFIRPEGMS